MIELILTVCATAQPSLCEDRHFQFMFNGSLKQCAAGAQVLLYAVLEYDRRLAAAP